MAHRADAADARRDRRHLVKWPAFGEFFEAAHLGHVKLGVGDMARIVQKDVDLGVAFDARDGVDDEFLHGDASYPNFTFDASSGMRPSTNSPSA